jgi:purine-cytosine permease-like protein
VPRNASQSGSGEPEIHQITNAVTPYSDDLDARIARYLVSMLIRTACVVLVIVVHHPVRWVFAVGAVALPYVAVIIANNTGRRRGDRVALGTPTARTSALGFASRPAAGPGPGTDDAAAPVVLTGVVQPRPDDDRAGRDDAA